MIQKVSRRNFLALSGSGLALAVFAPRGKTTPLPFSTESTEHNLNAFVRIDGQGQVTITCARSEMGQGVRTSMPMLVAEELEVDPNTIMVDQAVGDQKYGDQNTDGSTSVRTQWKPLREAGATARMMLIAAAAKDWSVAPESCRAENGRVIHAGSGRSKGYGELVDKAAEMAVPEKITLKEPKDFKVIGKSRGNFDMKDIVMGKAVYGIDAAAEGVAVASIERCPVVGGSIKSYNADKALAVKGVRKVVPIKPSGPPANTLEALVVVGDNTWAVLKGRKALEIEWDEGPNAQDNTEKSTARLKDAITKKGKAYREEGNIAEHLKKGKNISADYHSPYLAHSPMEAPACLVKLNSDSCEVWAPSQHPQWGRGEVAKALGMDPSKVTFNVTLLGGGFGRKSKPDIPVEAALAAKAAGMSLKVLWTREDEIRHGYYRSENMQHLEASLDEKGMPTAWLHRTAFPTIMSSFQPGAKLPSPFEMEQSCTTLPYRIPHVCMEACEAESPLRIGWLRSVHHTFHSWAINCFVDELAQAAGKDVIQYHLDLLGEPRILELTEQDKQNPYKQDTGRLANVIKLARDKSGWGKKMPSGRALGFAAQYSFFSYVAMVADVSITNGTVKVNRYTAAVDCGTVVNPNNVKAQVTGGVIFGLSAALHGKLTVDKGRVQQSNFDTYPMLRMSEAPEIEVHLVDSDKAPTGIGEPGVPPVAPALCNALHAITGKRIYNLPIPSQT